MSKLKYKSSEDSSVKSLSTITINSTSISDKQKAEILSEVKKKVWNVTIGTEWIGESAPYTQIITVENLLETDVVNMYPIYSDTVEDRAIERDEYDKISLITSTEGSVIVTCDEEKPTKQINVRLEVIY